MRDHERDASSETFPDWLDQIKGEYLHLTELYEEEREYGQRLAELMARVQHEVGFPIPLNPIVLSAVLPDVTEAQLGEGAVISYVDSAGNRGTRPLTLMPLETIISTVHECTFRLKELISEKRRLMARRVQALERVNFELDKAQETLKYSQPDSEPELVKVGEAPSGLPSVNLELDNVNETLKYSQPDSEPELVKVGEAPSELTGVNLELDNVNETLKYSQPDSEPELVKVGEAPSELTGVNLELDKTHETLKVEEVSTELAKVEEVSTELAKVEEASSKLTDLSGSLEETSKPAEASVGGFEFRGSFKDKRRALDEKVWGPE